jgi:hypothetical protein
MFSLALFTAQDLWILVTGAPYALHGLRGGWYLLWAAIATLFSATTVFIWRPGLPRIVIGLFSISMASHILEQFVGLSAQELKLVALCRVFVAVALILLVLRYRSTTTVGKSGKSYRRSGFGDHFDLSGFGCQLNRSTQHPLIG